jgi:hypothetical protein
VYVLFLLLSIILLQAVHYKKKKKLDSKNTVTSMPEMKQLRTSDKLRFVPVMVFTGLTRYSLHNIMKTYTRVLEQ